jgi:DnaJ like chaperone protein
MSIWGRVIGTLLGYGILGFFGAFIGFFIGGWFDKGLNLHLHTFPRDRTALVQAAFFRATFLMMGYIAKADGYVSEQEIRVAKKIMSRLELDETLRSKAILLFTEGKNGQFNFQDTLDKLYQECARHPDLLRFFIEIQLEAALADGELRPEEKRLLLLICEKLRVPPREFEQLWARQYASQTFQQWFYEQVDPNQTQYRQQQSQQQYQHSGYQASIQNAYGVLGISSSATDAEIKKAYRKLMSQHHPDKLASRGLPEGMVKLAKEKTQEIRAAYDLIKAKRGFR